jgi:hypothetical protein
MNPTLFCQFGESGRCIADTSMLKALENLRPLCSRSADQAGFAACGQIYFLQAIAYEL